MQHVLGIIGAISWTGFTWLALGWEPVLILGYYCVGFGTAGIIMGD